MKLVAKKKPVLKKPNKEVVTPTPQKEPTVAVNLRDIMDYDRVFNIIYSGVEQQEYFDILYDRGVRNFLISFHYVQNKHLSMDKQYGGLGVKFFVDSGAHTYQNDPKYSDYDIDYWEKHLQKYLRWVEKNREYIFAIASFDFENIVGAEKVKEWNEKYFEPFMLRTGIPVCFVWHQNSYYDWDFYCKRYPYVGFSSVNTEGVSIELKEYQNKLKIAENNKALVHGFGMTRTSMLTQLPFYTADSTTWLVGLQYGEINWWSGSKMSRLKKDKWKGGMLDQIVALGFDRDKLLEEDTEELVKVNVHAFIEAEEYIQTRLKSRMYWLRPDKVERSESDLDSIEYPSPEWISNSASDASGWEKYAKELNVTTSDETTAVNNIIDLTIFMNWYSDTYAEIRDTLYTPELIKELHDMWVNRIVSSDEERVEDLIDFYKECLLGKNDKLLVLGTNFDRLVKERDSYVDDTEYDYEDVSEMEISNLGAKYLPAPKEGSPAPEIDDLDDEIFKENEIIPVRDEKGHFLKGQRKVARPKKMYSNKYPKMACDMCINAQTCPEYKAGYVCAYNKMFERYNTRDMGDIVQAMQGIANYSLVRLQRAMINETMNGGLPDPAVSSLMTQAMGLMTQMQRLYETGSQEVIRQTKVLRSDGTQETTTQVSNPQAGGILEKIFGDMSSKDDDKTEEIIDNDSGEVE